MEIYAFVILTSMDPVSDVQRILLSLASASWRPKVESLIVLAEAGNKRFNGNGAGMCVCSPVQFIPDVLYAHSNAVLHDQLIDMISKVSTAASNRTLSNLFAFLPLEIANRVISSCGDRKRVPSLQQGYVADYVCSYQCEGL